MTRFFVTAEEMATDTVVLTGENAQHAKVLRLKTGEQVLCCDGENRECLCQVEEVSNKDVVLRVLERRESTTEAVVRVSVYMAFPKADKLEHVIQKATELGAYEIVTFPSSRCVSRPDDKSLKKKLERWQKIAAEAAEQCGRGMIPTVHPPIPFEEAVRQSARCTLPLFCYEGDGACSLKEILAGCPRLSDIPEEQRTAAVLIGPEGGYDTREVHCIQEAKIPIVNLGSRILRCETASGFVLACMTYEFEL